MIARLSLGVAALTLALLSVFASDIPPRFMTAGFFCPGGFIAWKDVASWQWGAGGTTVMLSPTGSTRSAAIFPS